MNGCKQVDLNFDSRAYYNSSCEPISNNNNYLSTSYYVNVSKLNFTGLDSTLSGGIRICKYDLSKNFISYDIITVNDNNLGEQSISLDPNYLYRFSYSTRRVSNVSAYNCNVSVGSMANELAFGKLTFLDQIGTIIPFVIPLIAFALGFLLLKKMIKRGNEGHA